MERVRTFIALELEPPVLSWLASCLEALRQAHPRIRWVHPEHLHVTMKFLGDVPEARLEEVTRAAAAAAALAAPFRLSIEGAGSFGNRRSPRTLWLGLSPLEALGGLHRRLEDSLAAAGFPRDERPFNPHLTLGRNPHGAPAGRWEEEMLPWPGARGEGPRGERPNGERQSAPASEVDALHVFSSDLRPGGPVHRLLSRSALGHRSMSTPEAHP